MTLLLEARHLVKRFFGITVVDDVSFVVRPGEVVGYLGPNGSRKTTTGRMLTGLVEPSGGSIFFDGRNISLRHLVHALAAIDGERKAELKLRAT